jgi:hypothetical protein
LLKFFNNLLLMISALNMGNKTPESISESFDFGIYEIKIQPVTETSTESQNCFRYSKLIPIFQN